VGLCVSGMTDPKNISAFLDVTGRWSPNLAGVMLGAIAVHAAWLRLGARVPALSPTSRLAPQARLDGALLGGAALFGVGWGLSGYCPGPSLVALGSGAQGVFVFVAAMAVGIGVAEAAKRPRATPFEHQQRFAPSGARGRSAGRRARTAECHTSVRRSGAERRCSRSRSGREPCRPRFESRMPEYGRLGRAARS
jgi:hypothetical protein